MISSDGSQCLMQRLRILCRWLRIYAKPCQTVENHLEAPGRHQYRRCGSGTHSLLLNLLLVMFRVGERNTQDKPVKPVGVMIQIHLIQFVCVCAPHVGKESTHVAFWFKGLDPLQFVKLESTLFGESLMLLHCVHWAPGAATWEHGRSLLLRPVLGGLRPGSGRSSMWTPPGYHRQFIQLSLSPSHD